jgi:hypothetical protein
MKKTSKKWTLALAVVTLVAMIAAGQNPPTQPKPDPAMEKLKYFLGDWKEKGTMKPDPKSPGDKFTGTYHNVMMHGGFFLEMHETGDVVGPGQGKFTSVAFIGYNAGEKVYTHDEFDSNGQHFTARGTLEGDTWTWTSDVKMGGQTMKGRFTQKITSPTSYDYKYEASIDGGEYTTFLEGKATKVGAAANAKPAGGKPSASKGGKAQKK